MTPKEVSERIESIRAISRDNERAHVAEDDLYRAVLGSIADGSCEDPAETARVALGVYDIEYARWYA